MVRFAVTRSDARVEIRFDDGGMNLLSAAALEELGRLIAAENAGAGSSMLIFRSGRARLFAAGADMAEMRAFTPHEAMEFSRLGQELFARIEKLPRLTVALIDGDCYGGALDLALAFDVRFATPRSRFAHPGARLGIVTGFGGTTRWRKLLQPPAAHLLFIENRVLSAEEAARHGLVHSVTDDFDAAIGGLGSPDPRVVRLTKELSAHAHRLTRPQLELLAKRLGNLYFGS